MIYLIILTVVIIIEGLLISISLVRLDNGYLANYYEQFPINKKEQPYFYVLISVFNEALIIEDTYSYFKKMLRKYNNIECIFITTEKENKVFGYNRTKEIIEKCIIGNKQFRIIHYPYTSGNKPLQLNFALEEIRNKAYSSSKKIYICQYDADSRPHMNTFDDITNIIMRTDARVIQQQTNYNLNYCDISRYMRLEACFQSRWAFGFERRNQKWSMNKKLNRIFMPYAYCVGHGMVVESKFLYDVGMYPAPSEDVPFGLKMMLIEEPIYPAVLQDNSSVTSNIKDLINQSGNWVKAPLLAIKIYKETIKIKKINIYRSILFFLKVCGDFLSWIQYLFLVILYTGFAIRTGSLLYLIICYILLFIDAAPGIYFTHKYIFKEKNLKDRMLLIFISPVRSIIRGISVISFVKQSIFGWYYDKGRNE